MSTSSTGPDPARIVVGVDGSSASKEALRWAARLAPTLGATIHAVSAWEYPYPDASMALPVMDWEEITTDMVAVSLRDVFGDEPPAGLVSTVEPGRPARTILEASHGAAMIIVGSRGLGGFAGVLLGSVSRYVAEHATCPVLVVHAPARHAD